MIFSKVIDIQNFLNLVIKHYPNYMRITDELQLVVNSIDNEVSKRSYHGNKIQNMEPSFWILFPGLVTKFGICPIILLIQIRTSTGVPNYCQLKKYYQLIENLQNNGYLGEVMQPCQDYRVLGITTSNIKPTATGTWFFLHFLSIKEIFNHFQNRVLPFHR